jgi:hypothetical protein
MRGVAMYELVRVVSLDGIEEWEGEELMNDRGY